MRIDLHAHSNASDGTSPPAEVMRRARAADLDVVALTDHDTTRGYAEALAAIPDGLTLVTGAEISCDITRDGEHTSLHLLAYLFDPDEPEFAAERDLLRTGRGPRGQAIVERLNELGAPVSWERVLEIAGDAAVSRPHIARAMVEAGVVPDVASAFTPDWIANGGRAYVEKHELDPIHAIRLVRAAGGVPVFAHPGASKRGRVASEDVIVAMAAAGLAGLEVDHPDHDPQTRARLRGLADELGLFTTGSSDDHGTITGHRLGCETTGEAAYDALVAQASGAAPVSA